MRHRILSRHWLIDNAHEKFTPLLSRRFPPTRVGAKHRRDNSRDCPGTARGLRR